MNNSVSSRSSFPALIDMTSISEENRGRSPNDSSRKRRGGFEESAGLKKQKPTVSLPINPTPLLSRSIVSPDVSDALVRPCGVLQSVGSNPVELLERNCEASSHPLMHKVSKSLTDATGFYNKFVGVVTEPTNAEVNELYYRYWGVLHNCSLALISINALLALGHLSGNELQQLESDEGECISIVLEILMSDRFNQAREIFARSQEIYDKAFEVLASTNQEVVYGLLLNSVGDYSEIDNNVFPRTENFVKLLLAFVQDEDKQDYCLMVLIDLLLDGDLDSHGKALRKYAFSQLVPILAASNYQLESLVSEDEWSQPLLGWFIGCEGLTNSARGLVSLFESLRSHEAFGLNPFVRLAARFFTTVVHFQEIMRSLDANQRGYWGAISLENYIDVLRIPLADRMQKHNAFLGFFEQGIIIHRIKNLVEGPLVSDPDAEVFFEDLFSSLPSVAGLERQCADKIVKSFVHAPISNESTTLINAGRLFRAAVRYEESSLVELFAYSWINFNLDPANGHKVRQRGKELLLAYSAYIPGLDSISFDAFSRILAKEDSDYININALGFVQRIIEDSDSRLLALQFIPELINAYMDPSPLHEEFEGYNSIINSFVRRLLTSENKAVCKFFAEYLVRSLLDLGKSEQYQAQVTALIGEIFVNDNVMMTHALIDFMINCAVSENFFPADEGNVSFRELAAQLILSYLPSLEHAIQKRFLSRSISAAQSVEFSPAYRANVRELIAGILKSAGEDLQIEASSFLAERLTNPELDSTMRALLLELVAKLLTPSRLELKSFKKYLPARLLYVAINPGKSEDQRQSALDLFKAFRESYAYTHAHKQRFIDYLQQIVDKTEDQQVVGGAIGLITRFEDGEFDLAPAE